ncbi:transcriptional regulator [Gramella sp. GC03-9]|uniref:Transcriptional regulator n=1 Tax=Christiangramia oceanisediminis TaxID=2920386 RepID=A0A9X2REC0_9FLAO|nr:transcriptional regulator [Gramella oceanisediminis]MCP9201251.1 transcriptional regulator [Gramella oceanisediminis]
MKNIISNINKAFDHRIRLGIMSVLVVNDHVDFKTLKELLGATDGNVASHTKALEKQKYIKVEKSFIDRKPNTRYIATEKGRKAFQEHLDALEKLLNTRNELK